MKKIAFALQVISLMALLPLCVFLEMNHVNKVATKTDSIIIDNKVEMTSVKLPVAPAYKVKI